MAILAPLIAFNPSRGYLADTEPAPLFTIVVLLAAFGVASVSLRYATP